MPFGRNKQAVQKKVAKITNKFCFYYNFTNALKHGQRMVAFLRSVGVAGEIMYCKASALISKGPGKVGEYS